MLFLQIVQMVLPVLVAMAIGFFCRRSGLLNAQGHAALKTVIGNITLPVVLFNAFLTAEYNAGLVLGFAVVFTACCIACAAGYALRPLVAPHGRFLPFLMSSFEVGMLGYALYGLLAGENGSLSTPVSYTHLDVYKRQGRGRAADFGRHGGNCRAFRPRGNRVSGPHQCGVPEMRYQPG